MKEQSKNDDQESSEDEVNCESINGMVTFTGENDEELFVLPTQERCFAHTLSLIATTDIKKTSYSPLHKKNFMSSFEKATAIWNKCNLSKSAEIIFNICKRNLVTPCITRWNSLFNILQCLLKFEQCTLKNICQKLYLPELTESEVEFLREYCTVLEPIAMAIDKVQGEQFSFYGYAIPVLRQTETLLKTIQNQSLKYNAPLVQTALRGMQKRFQPYLQQDFMVVKDALLATNHIFILS